MACRQKILEIAETIDRVCFVLEGKVRPELARLLFGTVAKESDFTHVIQIGGGPARGYLQMEPETALDLRMNWLCRKPALTKLVTAEMGSRFDAAFLTDSQVGFMLASDLFFACIMARLQYQRDPDPIPKGLGDQATYWKRVYNTMSGEGTAKEYVAAWNHHKCEAWCEIMGWGCG